MSNKLFKYSTFTLEPNTNILQEQKHYSSKPPTERDFVSFYHDTDTYNKLLAALNNECVLLFKYNQTISNTSCQKTYSKLVKLIANLTGKIFRAQYFLAAVWIDEDDFRHCLPLDFPFKEGITEIIYAPDSCPETVK
jgi:hypothetical protein